MIKQLWCKLFGHDEWFETRYRGRCLRCGDKWIKAMPADKFQQAIELHKELDRN